MGVSLSRNTITVARDGDVWRATLGSDANTGISSTATDPFKAIELTLNKAREKVWPFDRTDEPDEPKPAQGDGIAKTGVEAKADGTTIEANLTGTKPAPVRPKPLPDVPPGPVTPTPPPTPAPTPAPAPAEAEMPKPTPAVPSKPPTA